MRHLASHLLRGLPLVFALVFILAPLAVVALVSLVSSTSFEAFLSTRDMAAISFPTTSSYTAVATDPLYVRAAISSVAIALISALLAILIAFPVAYVVSRYRDPARSILAVVILLPFWTSFLLRIYAWTVLLNGNGPLNQLAMLLGISSEPIPLLHTNAAACVGIAYSYLPFAFLPIFASLIAIDRRYLEAAADLGSGHFACLVRIVVPLSFRGIISGFFLVFIPALGEFVVPELLGGPSTLTFGRALWTEFFANHDWPRASALGMSLLLLVALGVLAANAAKGAGHR